MPGFFLSAATTDVASSGSDVPAATSVRPITDSLTPNERAMPDAPSTKYRPPKINPAKPPIIQRAAFHIGIGLISSVSGESALAIENV